MELFRAVAAAEGEDVFGIVQRGRGLKGGGFGFRGGAVRAAGPGEGGLAGGVDAEEPDAVVGDERVAAEGEAATAQPKARRPGLLERITGLEKPA